MDADISTRSLDQVTMDENNSTRSLELVNIRPFVEADQETVVKLYRQGFGSTVWPGDKGRLCDWIAETSISTEGADMNNIASFYMDGDGHEFRHFWVAETPSGQIVGCVGAVETTDFPDCIELRRLSVSDEVRKKGVATELIAQVENWTRQLNVKHVTIKALHYMEPVIALCEKNGYELISKKETPNPAPFEIDFELSMVVFLKSLSGLLSFKSR